jgi:hypothetical protein
MNRLLLITIYNSYRLNPDNFVSCPPQTTASQKSKVKSQNSQ